MRRSHLWRPRSPPENALTGPEYCSCRARPRGDINMRRSLTGLLSRTVVLTASALVFASCTNENNPAQPSVQGLYTTPTGLLTSNPPQIFIGAGDISSCSNNGDEQTAEIIDTIPGTVYNLGDDAYNNGTTSEFNNCYHLSQGNAGLDRPREHSPG